MTKKKDGGSAFPEVYSERKYHYESEQHWTDTHSAGGMSLRDYFAARALEGFMVHQGWIGYMDTPEHRAFLLDKFAQDSYAIADAMLKIRDAASSERK